MSKLTFELQATRTSLLELKLGEYMVGAKGDTGQQGPPGPPGAVPEAPEDGTTYGRSNGQWVSVATAAALEALAARVAALEGRT